MRMEKTSVLHVVNIETGFYSATFLAYQIEETVWDSFVICRAYLYNGFPMKMRVDQGSAFTLVGWTNRTEAVGTDVQNLV